MQDHTGISNAAPSDVPIRYVFVHKEGHSGLLLADDVVEPRIHDYISNLRFSISPSAFFQVKYQVFPQPVATIALDRKHKLLGNAAWKIYLNTSHVSFVFKLWQVNTLAAEKLYSLAGDWAGLGPDTLLFDVCCGTGTIGLTLAHRVGMVMLANPFMLMHYYFDPTTSDGNDPPPPTLICFK